MKALQYIYTSWKNGNSTEKGYMIYSRSEGISEAECTAIKDAMQYLPPKEMNPAPTPEEISDSFPFSFAYFLLPGGRGCIAQSTYLGRDYSGRFGNYIIYALVFEPDQLPCRPAELFGEPYIKTAMTEEELSASSPVPPLPPIDLEDFGDYINDDQISEFLFERESEFAQLISLVLEARTRGIPFYLNDTRENLVLWSAAMQRILPDRLARGMMFNTYIGNHEAMRTQKAKDEGLDFSIIGVRPDANFFSYSTEYRSNRHIVMDILGGHMTEGVPVSKFAATMASSACMDFEEIEQFHVFLDGTKLTETDDVLNDAYLYFRLCRHDQMDLSEEEILKVLRFGMLYAQENDNSFVGSRILTFLQQEDRVLSVELLRILWEFVCKYSDFMALTLYDLVTDTVYHHAMDGMSEEALVGLLGSLEQASQTHYRDYLRAFNDTDKLDPFMTAFERPACAFALRFYIQWINEEYLRKPDFDPNQPVGTLFRRLLHSLRGIEGREELEVRLLLNSVDNQRVFDYLLLILFEDRMDTGHLQRISGEYTRAVSHTSLENVHRFEGMLAHSENGAPLAGELCSIRIAASKEPLAEFWSAYASLKDSKYNEIGFERIVASCLNALQGQAREKGASEMLLRMEPATLKQSETARAVCSALEQANIREIAKMKLQVLRQAISVYPDHGPEDLIKIRSIALGMLLQEKLKQEDASVPFSDVVHAGIRFGALNTQDYTFFVKNYLADFVGLVSSAVDMENLLEMFSHSGDAAQFSEAYMSILKRLDKADHNRWLKLIKWTSQYFLGHPGEKEALYRALLRCLRSMDEFEREDLQAELELVSGDGTCEHLFEDVQRKEGFQEKFGNLFKRK